MTIHNFRVEESSGTNVNTVRCRGVINRRGPSLSEENIKYRNRHGSEHLLLNSSTQTKPQLTTPTWSCTNDVGILSRSWDERNFEELLLSAIIDLLLKPTSHSIYHICPVVPTTTRMWVWPWKFRCYGIIMWRSKIMRYFILHPVNGGHLWLTTYADTALYIYIYIKVFRQRKYVFSRWKFIATLYRSWDLSYW